jgi:hypothetical protein
LNEPVTVDLNGERPLALNRRFLLFSLLAALLLSWPLLVFGRPSYMQDSAAYYKGGRAAVSFAATKLGGSGVSGTSARPPQHSGAPAAEPEIAAKEVNGVRSITYSVAAYLLSAPQTTLLLLVIAQALTAGVVIVATLGAFGGLPVRRTTGALIVLGGATTVAPVSSLAVPDIFAGLLIGSMVLLTVAVSRLSLGVRLLCAAIATFAVTAHASHIPLAAGLTLLGFGCLAVRRYYNHPLAKWTWAWVAAPLVIGGITILAINRIAFGETSLTSKRYPFALSRSINNGPGRWYLEKHCPELRYTICTLYPHGLPKGGAIQFLWGRDGVVELATPAQMDRIRAEEAEIVLAAGREYFGYEARRLTFNLALQLVRFRPDPFVNRLVLDGNGTPQLAPATERHPKILVFINILTAISVSLGTVWLGVVFFAERSFRPAIALVFLGILGNAVICVVLAAVASRYQARVVWLIPLFALALSGSPMAENSVARHFRRFLRNEGVSRTEIRG